MSTRPKAHAGPAVLRARAAKELAERAALDASLRAETESTRLLHELKVHQIELEIQNEELVEARDELESGLNRYTELFDFAPLGYALIDAEFEIRELNLAGAELLGSERARLVGQSFKS
jgi:PAS domain-containing protein